MRPAFSACDGIKVKIFPVVCGIIIADGGAFLCLGM